MSSLDRETLDWLLDPEWPPARYLALRDIIGAAPDDVEMLQAQRQIPSARHVTDLLAGQQEGGGFGGRAYDKWRGAHWRLVTLVDLGISPDHPGVRTCAENVLGYWPTDMERHPTHAMLIEGRWRRCGSQEGNVLGCACYLGMAEDPRARSFAENLLKWQWPDGGWNCDKRPEASHSSFHESVKPMWALAEYHRATGDEAALTGARRTAELLLEHCLFRSSRTGEVIHPEWAKLHWPVYWHYDMLTGLDNLRLLDGGLQDERASEALDLIQAVRGPDGRWRHTGRRYWSPPGKSKRGVEVTDWGPKREPSKMITLIAMRVLAAAGRLKLAPQPRA